VDDAPNPSPPEEHWQITVKAEGAGPPVWARLKRFAKGALRGYGVRIVDWRKVDRLEVRK
jgi:hypothetical protein